jgi:rubrerythrin
MKTTPQQKRLFELLLTDERPHRSELDTIFKKVFDLDYSEAVKLVDVLIDEDLEND